MGVIATNWLIIADRESIFSDECLKLAQLHNIAVDYPKTGEAVPLSEIPKSKEEKKKKKKKPDWCAPETETNAGRYYTSESAVGRLFRAIKLPALETAAPSSPSYVEDMRMGTPNAIVKDYRRWSSCPCNILARLEVERRVQEFIVISDGTTPKDRIKFMWALFVSFACQLRSICAMNTIAEYSGLASLTEEEALIGTIAEKTSQPRRRTDAMVRLRDQSERLVKAVRGEIFRVDGASRRQSLLQAWIAYNIGLMKRSYFGGKSFAWIALGEIFDAMKDIEEEERALQRQANA